MIINSMNNLAYKPYVNYSNNITNLKQKQNNKPSNITELHFKGTKSDTPQDDKLTEHLLNYMVGMKNRLIKILKEENLLTEIDIHKIEKTFDKEICFDSMTTKHILEDIEYMKSSTESLEHTDDYKMLLAQDTIPVRFYYEVAHKLYTGKEQALGMQVAKKSTQITGAQIYPGADIAPGVFFSHSLGTIIGNTAYIGPRTKIYGGAQIISHKTLDPHHQGKHRHAHIDGDTLIGAGSIILGDIEVKPNTIIGAGAITTHDVPPNTVVRSEHANFYPMKV